MKAHSWHILQQLIKNSREVLCNRFKTSQGFLAILEQKEKTEFKNKQEKEKGGETIEEGQKRVRLLSSGEPFIVKDVTTTS